MSKLTPISLEELRTLPQEAPKTTPMIAQRVMHRVPDLTSPIPIGYTDRVYVVAFHLWVSQDMQPDYLMEFAQDRMEYPEGPNNYPQEETYYIREAKLVREVNNASLVPKSD